jgi:TetR/AcrR family transcriptional regulator, transcriptional repressor for nem operon
MSKAEKTREYIIERSAPLFNTKGYANTSLSDIMEATGLTKGSIYGNFENKDEVAIAVFGHNVASMQKRMAAAMLGKGSATDKLIAFTEFYRNNWKAMFERGGCPIQNASVEADDNISFLKKYVQSSIKAWVNSIEKIIEDGKANGEFKKNPDSKESAYAIITILEGGIMLSKIMNNQKLLFSALDRIVVLINKELKK